MKNLKKYFISTLLVFGFVNNLSAITVYYWRLWCNTENDWVYSWSETEPIICPNTTGPAHTINPSSISEFGELGDNIIMIQDETIPTGRHYRAETTSLDIATGPSVTSILEKSWPFPISFVSFNFTTTSDHEGDLMDLAMPVDLLVGAITQDVSVNDTVITVTQDVIDNVKIGYYVTLNDSTNTENLGRVLSIDKTNLTITMETPATNAYLASTPTMIYLTVYALKDFEIGPPQTYMLGSSLIGTTHIPANMIAKLNYLNNSADAKKIIFTYEYMY